MALRRMASCEVAAAERSSIDDVNAVTSTDETSKQPYKNVCDRPFCEATPGLTTAALPAGDNGSGDSDLRIIGTSNITHACALTVKRNRLI